MHRNWVIGCKLDIVERFEESAMDEVRMDARREIEFEISSHLFKQAFRLWDFECEYWSLLRIVFIAFSHINIELGHLLHQCEADSNIVACKLLLCAQFFGGDSERHIAFHELDEV